MLRRHWRLLSVFLGLFLCILVFSKCVDKKKETTQEPITAKNGEKYAGTEACQNCHKDIHDHFIKTAHYLTSQPANENTIKRATGMDASGYFFNPFTKISVENREDSFYEVEYYRGAETVKHKMDITIGSGTRGQTYLTWRNNNFFQLPVSFFASKNSWANSPGFPEGIPMYNRVIYGRCLECHTTYTDYPYPKKDRTEKKPAMVFGVSCERCHGPAEKHVEYHTKNPDKKEAAFIINPSSFTRTQTMDLCALCHSGTREPVQPAFSFTAGKELDHYFKPADTISTAGNIDVHVNQYGLLTRSKCYLQSTTLTCTTCHNTHNPERNDVALFSQRCMTCHKQNECHFCAERPTMSASLTANCIDCHMPVQDSKVLTVQTDESEKKSPARIRSHFISIYPQETEKVLEYINKKS